MDKKKAKEFTDSIFNKLNDQERVYLAWIHNQKNKEIKRLNDIINELEKELHNKKEFYERQLTYRPKNDSEYNRQYADNCALAQISIIYDRLQELKGDKSNETNK